jgi:hypothetical protein
MVVVNAGAASQRRSSTLHRQSPGAPPWAAGGPALTATVDRPPTTT